MPQMFPMPAIFLVILVSCLLVMSMVRIYWYSLGSPLSSRVSEFKASTYFIQTW